MGQDWQNQSFLGTGNRLGRQTTNRLQPWLERVGVCGPPAWAPLLPLISLGENYGFTNLYFLPEVIDAIWWGLAIETHSFFGQEWHTWFVMDRGKTYSFASSTLRSWFGATIQKFNRAIPEVGEPWKGWHQLSTQLRPPAKSACLGDRYLREPSKEPKSGEFLERWGQLWTLLQPTCSFLSGGWKSFQVQSIRTQTLPKSLWLTSTRGRCRGNS